MGGSVTVGEAVGAIVGRLVGVAVGDAVALGLGVGEKSSVATARGDSVATGSTNRVGKVCGVRDEESFWQAAGDKSMIIRRLARKMLEKRCLCPVM